MNIRACVLCHYPLPRQTALCEECSIELWELRRPSVREGFGYPIKSLFWWDKTSPPAIAWLARSMKRQVHLESWMELAAWMAFTFDLAFRQPVWVPIPSRGPNHALGMAKAFSRVVGGEVADILQLSKPHAYQKTLGREDRRQITFEAIEPSCTDFRDVMIVDDIVTTGSTMEAAYKALGRPNNCEAWCLIDRRPCGTGLALL